MIRVSPSLRATIEQRHSGAATGAASGLFRQLDQDLKDVNLWYQRARGRVWDLNSAA
jgi:hypothetical protein